MQQKFGNFAQRVYATIASPWALLVAIAGIVLYELAGPAVGLPPQRIELSFLLTLATFLLVFLVEHEGYRDNAATQVKLDEIIRALDADRSKIGIEDRPPREIESVRDAVRAEEGAGRVR
jgi:low affinity Fe/Cu permease